MKQVGDWSNLSNLSNLSSWHCLFSGWLGLGFDTWWLMLGYPTDHRRPNGAAQTKRFPAGRITALSMGDFHHQTMFDRMVIISGWWFETLTFFIFQNRIILPISLTFIFFRGVGQPPSRYAPWKIYRFKGESAEIRRWIGWMTVLHRVGWTSGHPSCSMTWIVVDVVDSSFLCHPISPFASLMW